jgi:AbrB family looped-hinge helix DNA binding protein
MKTIKLQQRGVLTLPKKLRDQLGLTEGQSFRVDVKDNQIILEPELSAHDRQLMEDIRESLEDLKHGRYIEFSTIDELHEKIKPYEDSVDR